jgi:DNA-binding phage protein
MNTDTKFQQCTTRFKDYLLKDLAQPEFAKGYLEAALQDFDKDGNIEILLLSMKDVAEAQGGIEGLVAWTNLSPQALTYLLNSKHPLQLDKVLDILSGLKDSSHSNHTVVDKGSTSMEEHN